MWCVQSEVYVLMNETVTVQSVQVFGCNVMAGLDEYGRLTEVRLWAAQPVSPETASEECAGWDR